MSLVTRLEDSIREAIREEISDYKERELALLEGRLVDLFMRYAAEHFILVRERD
jgi:hypothetical protein